MQPAPEDELHLETSSSKKSEEGEWVTDNEDSGNNNHDTDYKESSTSNDKSED